MSVNPKPVYRDRHDRRGRFSDKGGFTLVEVLIAFTVMATLLSVLFRGVVTMRAGAIAFDDHTHQDIVARAVLNDALAKRDLAPGSYTGIRDGLRWKLVAKSVDLTAQLPPPEQSDQGTAGASSPAPAVSGQTAQAQPATGGGNTTSAKKDGDKLQWKPQRLTVRVETNGRPLQIETLRLVKAVESP